MYSFTNLSQEIELSLENSRLTKTLRNLVSGVFVFSNLVFIFTYNLGVTGLKNIKKNKH